MGITSNLVLSEWEHLNQKLAQVGRNPAKMESELTVLEGAEGSVRDVQGGTRRTATLPCSYSIEMLATLRSLL